MWKEVQLTRKEEVLSSHFVESSRPSLTTVRLEVQITVCTYYLHLLDDIICLHEVINYSTKLSL